MNSVFSNIIKPLMAKNTLSIRHFRNFERKDPGIRKRAAIIQQTFQAEDDLDDMEANFFDLGKSHKQFEREESASRELKKYHIVRQKYFKEKLPNFLTWADKQQIKHLHSTNPQEWTVQRLSEGFPALPDIIQKIIKNNWVPKNANRVRRHDEAVQQTWQQFKTNKQVLQLPPDVVIHLNKFTSRELNLNPDLSYVEIQDVTKRELVKKGGEFSNIIQSYEALKTNTVDLSPSAPCEQKMHNEINTNTKNKSVSRLSHASIIQNSDKIKLNKKESMKMLTYDELQNKIDKSSKNHRKTNEIEESINTETKEIVLRPEELNMNFNVTKFKSEKQVNLYKPKRDYTNLMYPERINIPADKRKRGYTYRLNDCFYDSDGEFIYRVPGMS